MPNLTWLVALEDAALEAAVTRLRRELDGAGLHDAGPPGPGRAGDATVVWADRPLGDATVERLLNLAGPLVLAGPTLEGADPGQSLAEAAGVDPGTRTPAHDVRVRPGRDAGWLGGRVLDHAHAGTAHLGPHTHVHDGVLPLDKTADDVEVLLTARLGLADQPLVTWRPQTRVLTWTPGSRVDALAPRGLRRLFVLALCRALGLGEPAPVRVGLLGYGAIGHEHSRAVAEVPGLELAAVADLSAARLDAARRHSPGIRTHADAEALVADPGVDLVVVSTPPNTHAAWARSVLEAGKHVVVEKPFAIRTAEADEVLALARDRGRVALVYQNRRFDPDHLAIRRAVRAGRLGELFHLEAFVGGFGHPCNLWHSDAVASGGAFYDWGAHVLDQVLDLVDQDVEQVTAATHKLRWFDVSNADHSRVTVRFTGGAEATFVYSDLAAALKPRWYLLGTCGALVGHWRTERVVSRSEIGTLAEDVLAPADSPPLLDLHEPDGSVTRLATPPGPAHAFHAELADRIQFGLPTTVTGEQSRRVLAVMEAATLSAASGGRPVTPA
ncbi:MAG TPA: Gfo/Idh/MocA family oxidoreductase [Kineosporiaceae bacterium]|nr:Gfo/Idh/MocA family oxidoreductase [Kineosporiaceae bacterium]